MNQNTSTFQSAKLARRLATIAIVEALPVEEQTMLVEVINNRLKEQRRAELIAAVKLAEQDYAAVNVKRGSVADFMADLDSL